MSLATSGVLRGASLTILAAAAAAAVASAVCIGEAARTEGC
jgi:hypothetical protein